LKKKLSIIIPHINLKDILDECINSIYKYTEGIVFEIIVIDNNSIDGSLDMLREKYPHVRIIENSKNLGFNCAVNQGIKLSQSKYILIYNNDAILIEDSFSKMIEIIEDDIQIGAVGCKLIYPDGTLQYSSYSFPTFYTELWETFFLDKLFNKSKLFGKYKMSWWDHSAQKNVDWLAGTVLLTKKEIIERVGCFNQTSLGGAADMEFCYRLRDVGLKRIYTPHTKIIHYASLTTSKYKGKDNILFRANYLYDSILFYLRVFKEYNGSLSYLLLFFITKIKAIIRLTLLFTKYIFIKTEKDKIKYKIHAYSWILFRKHKIIN